LSKERESLLQEYNALKQRFDEEYHQLAERKRDFQQELDALGRLNMKIKGYSFLFHFSDFHLSDFYSLLVT